MVKIKIEFNLDQLAGYEEMSHLEELDEIGKVMDHIKNRISNGEVSGKVLDINGNSIGNWSIDM